MSGDSIGCLGVIVLTVVIGIWCAIDTAKRGTEIDRYATTNTCSAAFYHRAGHYSFIQSDEDGNHRPIHYNVTDDNVVFKYDVEKDKDLWYVAVLSINAYQEQECIELRIHLKDSKDIQGGEHQYGIPKHRLFSQTNQL